MLMTTKSASVAINAILLKMPSTTTLLTRTESTTTTKNMMNAGKPTTREMEKPQKRDAMLLKAASMTQSMTIATLNGKNRMTMSSTLKTGDQNSI
jgi:hypothetical protein